MNSVCTLGPVWLAALSFLFALLQHKLEKAIRCGLVCPSVHNYGGKGARKKAADTTKMCTSVSLLGISATLCVCVWLCLLWMYPCALASCFKKKRKRQDLCGCMNEHTKTYCGSFAPDHLLIALLSSAVTSQFYNQ